MAVLHSAPCVLDGIDGGGEDVTGRPHKGGKLLIPLRGTPCEPAPLSFVVDVESQFLDIKFKKITIKKINNNKKQQQQNRKKSVNDFLLLSNALNVNSAKPKG